jgi:hypothetical protein
MEKLKFSKYFKEQSKFNKKFTFISFYFDCLHNCKKLLAAQFILITFINHFS